MNWLLQQVVSSSVFSWASMFMQAVTWPAAAVVIARMFRGEVRLVLDRIVRLKFQDFEANFLNELRDSEELASHAGEHPSPVIAPSDHPQRVMHELYRPDQSDAEWPIRSVSPRRTIERAWGQLAAEADHVVGNSHLDPLQALVMHKTLDGPALLLFDRLRRLRTMMTRQVDWDPTADGARRYDDLAHQLVRRIRRH